MEEIPRYLDQYDKRDAALKCLDDAVGRIAAAVDQYGFNDNTLFLFTNDNGGLQEAFNRPYRGTKNTTFEGGIRVPCVVRWPGKVQPGATNDGMMHVVDVFNTLVTLAGGTLEQDRPLDGINMTDMIFGDQPSPRDEIVIEVSGSVRLPTIRKGSFKLVGDALYNLQDDPSETTDVAERHSQLVIQLRERLTEVGMERPPLGELPILMRPALPYVYGQQENENAPEWVKEHVRAIRATQPQEWAPGETPWPQAPSKTGEIIYTGDGR